MTKGHISFGVLTSLFFLSVHFGIQGEQAWCLFCVTLGSFELWITNCKGVLCCFGTEENSLGFGVSSREGLVAVHKLTDQRRAVAIVMSAEGCHVTALSAAGCPDAHKASAFRAALGVLVAGGSSTEAFSGNSLHREKAVFSCCLLF